MHRSFLKRFPFFIWLLSAVSSVCNFGPDTGRRDLLFRFASSVQSCCGERRALQTDIAVCGEHSPCSGHTGFAPHRAVCAFPVYTAQAPAALYGADPALSAVPVFGSSTKAWTRLCLRVVSSPASAAQAAKGLRSFSPARRAFSLRGPSARRRSGLRESSDRNRSLFAGWEGVASLGLSFPLSPPPASYLQRGWAGSSLEFPSTFALRTAGGVFRLVNFFSLSHSSKKSPSDCSQGLLAGPYPRQCRRLLSAPPAPLCSPPLADGGCGRLGYFSAGICF